MKIQLTVKPSKADKLANDRTRAESRNNLHRDSPILDPPDREAAARVSDREGVAFDATVAKEISQLENEFRILKSIEDVAGVPRAIGLEVESHKALLLLEDFGGISLRHFLQDRALRFGALRRESHKFKNSTACPTPANSSRLIHVAAARVIRANSAHRSMSNR